MRALRRALDRGQRRRRLARSARRFSVRTGATVDAHLTFAATLVRAGEVGAARRLLGDLEEEVREEGAALVRSVEGLGHDELPSG